MNKLQSFFLGCLSMLLIVACQDNPQDNPTLQEAFKLHKEAIAVHDEIMPQMKSLSELKDGLQQEMNQIQIRAEAMDMERFEALQQAHQQLAQADSSMRSWMSNLAEVPGFEDHDHGHEGHDHDHDHAHHHGDGPKLTPEQVLEVQQEQLKQIQQLKSDMDAGATAARQLLGGERGE
jgi:uncharacterized phage infection (PIP) family protein YhgE